MPSETLLAWKKFGSQLVELQQMEIPRMVVPTYTITMTLYGFSDASIKAYGCAIYLHATNLRGEESTILLCAKSRLATKGVSLPRLELQGAQLLAELAARIKAILGNRIQMERYYSDSQVVLTWIKSPNTKWEIFVRNRIAKIHKVTNPNVWGYVPTKENPADLVSRGVPVKLVLSYFHCA